MLELQTQRSHPALDSRGQTVRETKETEVGGLISRFYDGLEIDGGYLSLLQRATGIEEVLGYGFGEF